MGNSIMSRLTKIALSPLIYIVILAFIALIVWFPRQFSNSIHFSAGEAFEAYHGALNIELFGWKWAGLQDQATNPTNEAHPYYYIHHPNFGIYFSYLLQIIGIKSYEMQNAASGLLFLAGIVLGFSYLCSIGKSKYFGLLFVLFASLDLDSILAWMFNVHRSSTYFAVFGVLFTFWLILIHRGKSNVIFKILHLFFCLVLIGTDYMMFFYCFFAIFFVTLLVYFRSSTEDKKYLNIFGALVSGSLGFGAAFIIRQFQVLLGAGWYVWSRDIMIQVLNRLSIEQLFQGNWPEFTTNFYLTNNILNPGLNPSMGYLESVMNILSSTGHLIGSHIFSFQGVTGQKSLIVGGIIISIVFIFTIISLLYKYSFFSHHIVQRVFLIISALVTLIIGFFLMVRSVSFSMQVGFFSITSIIFMAILIWTILSVVTENFRGDERTIALEIQASWLAASLILACFTATIIFTRYFVQLFMSFNLSTTIIFVWISAIIFPLINASVKKPSRIAVIFIALAILKITIISQLIPSLPKSFADYADALYQLKGKFVVSNFTPASVATYTNSFSGSLTPEGIILLGMTGEVDPVEWRLFNEADRDNPLYRKPDYLIFFYEAGNPELSERLKAMKVPLISEGIWYALFDLRDKSKFATMSLEDIILTKPNNLKIVCRPDSNIQIEWEKVEYAKQYVIEMGTGTEPFIKIGDWQANLPSTYVIGGLSPTTAYRFRVLAERGERQSEYSDIVELQLKECSK